MGVDLRLLPMTFLSDEAAFSHSIIELERRHELWEPIEELERTCGNVVPANFSTFLSEDAACEDSHYGNTQITPYGDRIKYVEAKYLKLLSKHPGVQDNPLNRAVWAYLCELPDETKIALYWH